LGWTLFTDDDDPEHILGVLVTLSTLMYYPTINQSDLEIALEGNDPEVYMARTWVESQTVPEEHHCSLAALFPWQQRPFEDIVEDFKENYCRRQQLPAFDYTRDRLRDLNI
jgi:hypothetical protein